jgi:hypothetical protein
MHPDDQLAPVPQQITHVLGTCLSNNIAYQAVACYDVKEKCLVFYIQPYWPADYKDGKKTWYSMYSTLKMDWEKLVNA